MTEQSGEEDETGQRLKRETSSFSPLHPSPLLPVEYIKKAAWRKLTHTVHIIRGSQINGPVLVRAPLPPSSLY